MGEHICFRRNERLATVNPYWRGNPMVRGRFFNRQHRFRPGDGECTEMASFAQSSTQGEEDGEMGSESLLPPFIGCGGRRFPDMART